MLKRIWVDNYKCLVNFELRFGEQTLLLGPNGAGKSSVLEVVFALRQILSGAAKITGDDAFPGGTLTRWQTRPVQAFELDLDLPAAGQLTYRLEIEHERDSARARIVLERLAAPSGLLFEFRMGEVHLYGDDHTPGPIFPGEWTESWLSRVAPGKANPRLTAFLGFMRKVIVCGIYPKSIAAESRTEDQVLARDGNNFAAWYRGLVQERPERLPGYMAALRKVITAFKGLKLISVGQGARMVVIDFEESGQTYSLDLSEISDGQRALVVLYALLHLTAGQGQTLFLDEPDNYVALAEIQPWLMALADACGETVPQVVLCSHHPELIDYLGAEHGIQLERESSGVVTARSLGDRQSTDGLKLSEVIARGWES